MHDTFNNETERIDMKLYTLDNKFVKESNNIPQKFTGIVQVGKGGKMWLLNGEAHRVDGPARDYVGYKEYNYHNKTHRFDGPAVTTRTGEEHWFIYGIEYSKEKHELVAPLLKNIMKLKGLT